jgi:hypothetical protein
LVFGTLINIGVKEDGMDEKSGYRFRGRPIEDLTHDELLKAFKLLMEQMKQLRESKCRVRR